jgi:hypothetical protein
MTRRHQYRIYVLDEWRMLSGDWLDAESDQQAIAAARAANPASKCEVWENGRLIAAFGPGRLSVQRAKTT